MKTTNPLANLFQAAMGQCSTLPADAAQNGSYGQHPSGDNSSTAAGSRSSRKFMSRSSQAASAAHTHAHAAHAHHYQQQQRDDSDVVMADAEDNGGKPINVAAMVAAAKKQNSAFESAWNEAGGSQQQGQPQPQQQQPPRQRSRSRSLSRRRSPPSSAGSGAEAREPLPTIRPPDGSEKKRCYRLNLELPSAPSVDPATGQQIYGPLIYEPPPHHLPGGMTAARKDAFRKSASWHSTAASMHALQVSNSADSESGRSKSDVAIAISTAQIFRGITVDRNGTILTQNARASRSAKKSGDSKKVGEKSRQAAKIDKAKDLVDEDGPGGLDPDSKTQCLYIMGEYDDMKYLVKDGAKKLRDATNLTDEALLSINRQRTSSQSYSNPGTPMSNRKRISPYPTPTNGSTPSRSHSRSRSSSHQSQTGGTPPKLKANPRDSRSTRRIDVDPTSDCIGENAQNMQCNEIPGLALGKKGGDWTNKLGNIWNCGAQVNSDDTISPTNPASPASHKKMNAFTVASNACGAGSVPMREGRNESAYGSRGDGRYERVDAMGNAVA